EIPAGREGSDRIRIVTQPHSRFAKAVIGQRELGIEVDRLLKLFRSSFPTLGSQRLPAKAVVDLRPPGLRIRSGNGLSGERAARKNRRDDRCEKAFSHRATSKKKAPRAGARGARHRNDQRSLRRATSRRLWPAMAAARR